MHVNMIEYLFTRYIPLSAPPPPPPPPDYSCPKRGLVEPRAHSLALNVAGFAVRPVSRMRDFYG